MDAMLRPRQSSGFEDAYGASCSVGSTQYYINGTISKDIPMFIRTSFLASAILLVATAAQAREEPHAEDPIAPWPS